MVMPPVDVPRISTETTGGKPVPPTLDYAAPRSVVMRVPVPHWLYRVHRFMISPSGGLLTLIYCLIVMVVGGIFRSCGIVFVDAAAAGKPVEKKPPTSPSAQA
jgi:hypothetical protein